MTLIRIPRFTATLCLGCLAAVSTSHSGVAQSAATDSAAVAAVVEGFHAALSRGDSTTAPALMTAAAVILESGGIETRGESRSGHLAGHPVRVAREPRDRGNRGGRATGRCLGHVG